MFLFHKAMLDRDTCAVALNSKIAEILYQRIIGPLGTLKDYSD